MFNYKKHMQYKDYIEELPSKLYIYYKFNPEYNVKRLSGEVFFISLEI